tara:strand:- start:80 stop:376 length:297 start_codon:yes stop_codon:yes gene_type:complete
MAEHQKIKETLSVIRKALEDDSPDNRYNNEKNDDILILNQKINEDGTIVTVDDKSLNKEEIKKILNQKLDTIFETHLSLWFDKNMPKYIEKYFKNKKL